jgi:hypothetical protein
MRNGDGFMLESKLAFIVLLVSDYFWKKKETLPVRGSRNLHEENMIVISWMP